eukprot:TRINITY_DN48112_c0_g1_i1.p1 TRINITY_DN48112_c0_g1~~TRINITY_DN48112_c0_g1_i1.p1  ORF type:complete len:128 (+),score=4.11 TRINITY_DN48112_c0_g1_i1:104-487(+)
MRTLLKYLCCGGCGCCCGILATITTIITSVVLIILGCWLVVVGTFTENAPLKLAHQIQPASLDPIQIQQIASKAGAWNQCINNSTDCGVLSFSSLELNLLAQSPFCDAKFRNCQTPPPSTKTLWSWK